MKNLNRWVVAAALAGISFGCESIPKSVQGHFVTQDGKIMIVVRGDQIQVRSTDAPGIESVAKSAGAVTTGFSGIFKQLKVGETGIYIAPSMYPTMIGEQITDPSATRFNDPRMNPVYSESKTKLDIYAVFSTTLDAVSSEPLPMPLPIEIGLFSGDIAYFQADLTSSDPVSELKITLASDAAIMTQRVSQGLSADMETWMIHVPGRELRAIRQH